MLSLFPCRYSVFEIYSLLKYLKTVSYKLFLGFCNIANKNATLSVTREVITEKQQADYLGFIKQDKTYNKYYDVIFILFNTGLRISEFCGPTVSDIDFEKNRIKVDHQLIRASNMKYILQAPKTEKGIRYIPMTVEVADCFRRIISRRKRVRSEPVIGGRVGFLFLDKNSKPTVAQHWEKYMQRIREKYNNDIGRLPLPVITPHICRHTFCTNMARNGMNPKTLQYLMGHSEIGVTLDVYTHLGLEDAAAELHRMKEVQNARQELNRTKEEAI